MKRHKGADNDTSDDLGFFKGLCWALVLVAPFWAFVVWLLI